MLRKSLTLVFSLLFGAVAAAADSRDDAKAAAGLDKQARKLDEQARKAGDPVTFESLSDKLAIPVSTLQSQKQSTGFGFGQLFIANALARQSGKTFDQIAAEFRSGKGWGEIAHENNLELGPVVSDMKRAHAGVTARQREAESGTARAAGARPAKSEGRGRAGSPPGRSRRP